MRNFLSFLLLMNIAKLQQHSATHTHTHTRIQCQSSFAAIYYYNNKCSGLFPWVRGVPQHLPAEKMLAFFACQRKVCVFFQVVNMENVEQIALIAVVAVAV